MKRRFLRAASTALTAALLLSLFAGCGAGSNTYNQSASSSAAKASASAAPTAVNMSAADAVETPMEEGEAGTGGSALPPSLDLPDSAGRKIIWRVNMSLETLEFDNAVAGLTGAIQQAGGYIESSSVNGKSLEGHGSRRRYGSVTARIPQGQLDAFLSAVSAICNVVSTDRQSEDVTLQYTDIESRKRSLEIEQERLLELLGEAENIDTIVALESRLSEIRYQLDGYSSSLRTYDSLVDYSTVYMDISEVVRVSEPIPETLAERMGSGLRQTGRDISEGAQNLLVWLVVNLPYLLIWAILIAVLVLVLKKASRRRAAMRADWAVHRPASPSQGSPAPKADPYAANPYQDAYPAKPEEDAPDKAE